MKNLLYKGFVLCLCASILFSCSTTEKINVAARPGTEIYIPGNVGGYSVPESGKLKVELTSDGYYGYLLAKDPGSNMVIPFGVDCKNNSHIGTKAALGASYTVASAGVFGLLVGTIMICAGDDEIATPFFAPGAAGALLGGLGGMVTESRMNQLSYDYNFSYFKNQKAIQDMNLSAILLREDPPKEASEQLVANKRKRAALSSVSSDKKVESETPAKVKKRIKDYGKAIAGEYSGTGKLLQNKISVEDYSNIEVIISRISNNEVTVRIIESGEDYFESPLQCNVVKEKDGGYSLSISGFPSAKIRISSKGVLSSQQTIEIDDEVYVLKVDAKR